MVRRSPITPLFQYSNDYLGKHTEIYSIGINLIERYFITEEEWIDGHAQAPQRN